VDASRFDSIVRQLARPTGRRRAAALLGAVALGIAGGSDDAVARAPGLGKPCHRGQRCQAGTCRRRVCSCGDGERACADGCIAAEACCASLGERDCAGTCLSRDACCTDADCPDRPAGSACLRFGCRGDRTCSVFPAPAGTVCGDEDESACDAAGNCVQAGCRADADCPGHDDFCLRSSCLSGRCQPDPRADGTPLPGQADGDCRALACDGAGGRITVPDNADLPLNGDPCVVLSCDAGTVVCTDLPAGTPCGGGACDGRGRCA